jgi:hypothetical protein
VGGARESIHVESFKALTVIESKLDATRKKLARRLLEEQDKLSKAHFAQKGGEEGEGKGCLVTLVAHADYSGPCHKRDRGPVLFTHTHTHTHTHKHTHTHTRARYMHTEATSCTRAFL